MKSVATVSVQVQEQLSDVWQVQQRNLFLIGGGTDLSDCCSPFQWSRLRFLIAHTFRRQYNTSGQIRFDCDWSMDTSPLFPSPSLSSSSSMSVDGCHCGNSLTHTHTYTVLQNIIWVCVCDRGWDRGEHTHRPSSDRELPSPLPSRFCHVCLTDCVEWAIAISHISTADEGD